MEKKEWKYPNGSEWFDVLYHARGTILIRNANGNIGYINEDYWGWYYGFPVSSADLTLHQAKQRFLSEIKNAKSDETKMLYLDMLGVINALLAKGDTTPG